MLSRKWPVVPGMIGTHSSVLAIEGLIIGVTLTTRRPRSFALTNASISSALPLPPCCELEPRLRKYLQYSISARACQPPLTSTFNGLLEPPQPMDVAPTMTFGVLQTWANASAASMFRLVSCPVMNTNLRGSSARTFFSLTAIVSSASCQEISTHLGSTPRPFSGFVRFTGKRTRYGLYSVSSAALALAQLRPWLLGEAGLPSTFTAMPLTLRTSRWQRLSAAQPLQCVGIMTSSLISEAKVSKTFCRKKSDAEPTKPPAAARAPTAAPDLRSCLRESFM